MKKEIEHHLQTLQYLSEATGDFLFIWDFSSRRFYFTDGIYKKYNLERDEYNGHLPEDLEYLVYSKDLNDVRNLIDNLENGILDYCNSEFRFLEPDGKKVWYNCCGKIHYDENHKPEIMIGRISSAMIHKNVDSMTGVMNESRFLKDTNEYLAENKNGYLIVIAVDNFKNINVKHGRSYGDYILKNLTETMQDATEGSLDIYRLDGNRYVANMFNCTEHDVKKFFDYIQKCLEPECTISAGAVSYNAKGATDSSVLYQYAEGALDHARKNGIAKLEFFSAEKYNDRLSDIELLEDLKQSIIQNYKGFSLCYQPQFSCQECKVVGVEALLRFHSQKQGDLSPAKFIPLLEQSELIIPVGDWVLETALLQCKEWRKHFPDLHVSVNVSYVQLCIPNIDNHVLDILEKLNMPGDSLVLEITESMQLQDFRYFNKIFNTWRKCGIQIAIDDFGTGYSSLGYLKHMKVNEIKLDRCLVTHIHRTAYNYHLLENIIDLAHSAQIRVCCEGVELPEEFLAIKEIHADTLQGFLMAKPYTTEVFEEYFIQNNTPVHQQKIDELMKYYDDASIKITKEDNKNDNLLAILDNTDEIIYVSDPDTYELYYINTAGCKLIGTDDYKGCKCYHILQGRDKPCEFCTNNKLEVGKFYVWELENPHLEQRFVLKDKLIPWHNKLARMEIAIDIKAEDSKSIKKVDL